MAMGTTGGIPAIAPALERSKRVWLLAMVSRIYILPAVSVVVTVLAGRYNDPSAQWLPERLLIEHILPAVRMPADAGFKSEPAGCATGPRDA